MTASDLIILRRLAELRQPATMPLSDQDAYVDLYKRGLVDWCGSEITISDKGRAALADADSPEAPASLRYASAVAKIEVAGEAALAATMDMLVECAKRHRITRMEFLVTSHFYRRGREVQCEELSQIELRFCDDVQSTGFQAIWTVATGWQ